MPWPQREHESGRPFRRSPLYDRLKARGAWFGNKMGWDRPNWFAGIGKTPDMQYGWGRGAWFDAVAAEHKATREAVTVVDETSFGKFLIQGRDAEATLQRLCANDVAIPIGRTVYTGLLNERGTFESDVTLARLARDKFLLITGSAQVTRDADWIGRNSPQGAHVALTDVTGAWTVLSLMGPHSRKLLQKVSPADFTNAAFPFGTIREVSIGYATVLASRRTYMGELGWELYVPVEFAVTVFETLHGAGAAFGLRDMGYYAIEGLRIEKAYRAWGRELTPDDTPWDGYIDNVGTVISNTQLTSLHEHTTLLYKSVFLQRLADPTQVWNAYSNPYITMDWMPFDLTVFNSCEFAPIPSFNKLSAKDNACRKATTTCNKLAF